MAPNFIVIGLHRLQYTAFPQLGTYKPTTYWVLVLSFHVNLWACLIQQCKISPCEIQMLIKSQYCTKTFHWNHTNLEDYLEGVFLKENIVTIVVWHMPNLCRIIFSDKQIYLIHLPYLSFCAWIISHNIMPSRLIRVASTDHILFFIWLNSIALCICTRFSLSVLLLMIIISQLLP